MDLELETEVFFVDLLEALALCQRAKCESAGVLTASCSRKVMTLPFPLSSSPSALRGRAMGVLIALESAAWGTAMLVDSLNELECMSIVLASGSGVPPTLKPAFSPIGVARPLACRVRFATALFINGVNSTFAAGFRKAASVCRGVRGLLKRLSRPAGA